MNNGKPEANGHTDDDVLAFVERMESAGMLDAAARFDATEEQLLPPLQDREPSEKPGAVEPETQIIPATGPQVLCLADVAPRAVTWLWRDRIPAGRLSLLVGRPGEGKSFLVSDAAARISTGTPWPDGSPCERGDVLLIAAEDDAADTIRPRLDAHYADVNRIHHMNSVRHADEDGNIREMLFTLQNVADLEAALTKIPECRLVVIDPIGSFLGGRTDAHRDNEVRAVLAPLAALAEKHGVAMLLILHTRKAAAQFADDAALGSRAFTGIARAVWHLARDRNNKNRRLLLPGKCNLSAQPTGLAFTIAGDPPALCWEREAVDMNADDRLAEDHRTPGPEGEARKEAEDWLRKALQGGPRPGKELIEEAREGAGIAKRTLERARSSVGVEAYRPENPGPWWWRLEPEAKHTATLP